jgi:hypothetical protein
MEEDIFEAYPVSKQSSTSGTGALQYFINYLNVLEGIKTKIKNLHWAAKKLPVEERLEEHQILDDLLDEVSEYQDKIAEFSQGILGHMDMDVIQGVYFKVQRIGSLIKYILDQTIPFYENMPKDTVWVGLKSETETFIFNVGKYKYLFELGE